MSYPALVIPRKNHPSRKSKHAGKGLNSNKFPATNQTFGKRSRGKKIAVKYYNSQLADLKRINGYIGFWLVTRISGVLFNPRGPNLKWAEKWTKLIGVGARIPYPLGDKEYAVGEGIVCDGNVVTVIREVGQWCQLQPYTVVTLFEVDVKTGKLTKGTLKWRMYPDEKTGEIWMEKKYLRRL